MYVFSRNAQKQQKSTRRNLAAGVVIIIIIPLSCHFFFRSFEILSRNKLSIQHNILR